MSYHIHIYPEDEAYGGAYAEFHDHTHRPIMIDGGSVAVKIEDGSGFGRIWTRGNEVEIPYTAIVKAANQDVERTQRAADKRKRLREAENRATE